MNTQEHLTERIIFHRRRLHQIPETGTYLPKTKQYITDFLTELNIPYVENQNDSGLISYITKSDAVKNLAFRTDMDALPIIENTNLSFASTNGCMHACGHDGHMAIMLTVIEYLWSKRDTLPYNIYFIFQTSEETAEGARMMCDEPFFKAIHIDEIYGLHVGCINPQIGNGCIGIMPGSIMASYDKFFVSVHGLGSHGSTPEKSIDPVLTAASLITELNMMKARELDALNPVSISIGHIEGGSTYNVIPDTCYFEGTFRAFSQETREFIAMRIKDISENIARAHRATANVTIVWGGAPVVNDKYIADKALLIISSAVGKKFVTQNFSPVMIGEDFSYYLKDIPGCFFLLTSQKGAFIPHHNPHFDIDESVLFRGAQAFIALATT